VGLTLAGMLALSGAIILTGMGDPVIRILNQVMKAAAVAAGTFMAVGRAGQRGLVTGAAIGTVYSVAGYVLYILLGGGDFRITGLLGEMLLCIAAGAASGAIFANMRPRRRKA